MKKALIIAIAILPTLSFCQASDKVDQKAAPAVVSVSARATDVRAIIADLFTQAKLNYTLEPGIQAALFLQLDKVSFDDALNIICTQAHLQFQIQNGIYFITHKTVTAPPPAKPKGTLDKGVLTHKLTAKMSKTDIRVAFAAITKQTHVAIDIDKSVPNFKLDLTLTNTTLHYALDKVTDAAGLKYRFTDTLSILIYRPDDGNKVSISKG